MWKAITCEVQGRGHIKAGVPCQDKTKKLSKNDIDVICLSDGAGSAKFSHYGAQCIVECASEYIVDNFQKLIAPNDGRQIKVKILDYLRQKLIERAVELECAIEDLASTLLLVAISMNKYLIIHIGDGVIGYIDKEDLKIASLPDNGEFANTTTFVSSKNALSSMRLFKGNIKEIAGFILMSDGVEQSLYSKPTKSLAQGTVKLLRGTCILPSTLMQSLLENLLKSLFSQYTQDDCSIAILARPTPHLLSFAGFELLELAELFGISRIAKNTKKRIYRYKKIIEFLATPKTLGQISVEMRIKPKYLKKYLKKLIDSGFLKNIQAFYSKA